MTTLSVTSMALLAHNGTMHILKLVVHMTLWDLLHKMLVVHAKVVIIKTYKLLMETITRIALFR